MLLKVGEDYFDCIKKILINFTLDKTKTKYELKKIRCPKCGFRMFDADLIHGAIEAKCKKCGTINRIEVTPRQAS